MYNMLDNSNKTVFKNSVYYRDLKVAEYLVSKRNFDAS